MDQILLTNIRLFAYHGCLDEEAAIGSDYRVDLQVSADLSKAASTDDLKDTVDYVHLQKIVKEEMQVRSKLLEHVAKRIIDRVFEELSVVATAEVAVSKLNPPIGGDVEAVTVTLKENRS